MTVNSNTSFVFPERRVVPKPLAGESGASARRRRDQYFREQVEALKATIVHHVRFTLAKYQPMATTRNYYQALVHALRDHVTESWIATHKRYYDQDVKRVYYLSAEFMIGRLLDTVLTNLHLDRACRQALTELGYSLEAVSEHESDAGLGTGGLGRLAACLLDSMATLGVPAYGYGIRYEYGIFYQKIENGQQIETPDNWLRYGNPWEIGRPEFLYPIHFYGRPEPATEAGGSRVVLADSELVMAMAYDIPIPGYGNNVVNTLRLWAAKSSREFDLDYFNHGDYNRAVEDKNKSENISRVLYPRDDTFSGRELRLKQEYFLVSASLQDIIRRYKTHHETFEAFPDKAAIQLNDTHPALAVPELMRLLVDQERLDWEGAWDITVRTLNYTNHTLMPEALEKWPVNMLGAVLPRMLQIIYEINHRFLGQVAARFPGDVERLRHLSLIEEGEDKLVRMAHVAVAGSKTVNGVSKLHSELLRSRVFPDFAVLFPERFSNKTNGITPRLWLKWSNPALAELLSRYIGERWITRLEELERLIPLADDAGFCAEWVRIKVKNKVRLADAIRARFGPPLDPNSLFDCQVKRIHEYKRQVLNLLHAICLYIRLKETPQVDLIPRSVIFAGKAAPAYWMAKHTIKLINAVAAVVNKDRQTNDRLKVVFVPNYSVSLAEQIMPAVDLSEQISTAGTEASGTSNMKMALNGAITIGTLDGANIEIRQAVGPENFFVFGLSAEEIDDKHRNRETPEQILRGNPELGRALDMIRQGFFSPQQKDVFQPIVDSLLRPDNPFLVLADFAAYDACQRRVESLYRNSEAWTRMSIYNTARMGWFSSDRTVREYARDTWGIVVE